LTTKYEDGSYESEYRLFVELKDKETNGLYYFDFGPEFVLREAILGSRCPLDLHDVAAEIQDPRMPVELLQARPAFDSFRIVRQQQVLPMTVRSRASSG